MGKVLQKIGITFCCILGTLATVIYTVLLGTARSIIMVYIAGAFAGLAWAFGLAAPVSIVIGSWFVKKRSQMLGIGMGIMSLGGVVILFVVTRMAEVFSRSVCFIILAAVNLVVGLFVDIVLIKSPEQIGQKPLGGEEINIEESKDGTFVKVGLTLKEAMRTFAFWILLFGSFIFTLSYEGIASYAPTYYAENGASETLISNMAILLQAGIFLGGIAGGWIGEYFGSKIQTIVLCLLLSGGLFSLFLWSENSTSIILLTGAVAIGGLGNACFSVLPPSLCNVLFGDKDYDSISPITVSASYCGSILSAVIMNLAILLGNMKYYYLIMSIGVIAILIFLIIAINTSPVKKMIRKEK